MKKTFVSPKITFVVTEPAEILASSGTITVEPNTIESFTNPQNLENKDVISTEGAILSKGFSAWDDWNDNDESDE